MRDTLALFAAMFAVTALIEAAVLRRYLGRRTYAFCVCSVSLLSGVIWMATAITLFHIRWGWKAADEAQRSESDWAVIVLFVLLDVLLLSAAALIPAATVALAYRRWRIKHGCTG